MKNVLDAIQSGASSDDIAALSIPESYRAAYVKRDEQTMFEGMDSYDKDPRKSLHVGEVETPELAPDEVYLAVMASSINFNTVWTSIFEPLPTFGFLDRLGRESSWGARHARDYHVVGSDASGVVLQVGSAVRNWKPGDKVTVTATTSMIKTQAHTTTRCMPTTSAFGASRRTLAAWQTCRLSKPTSSCRSRRISHGKSRQSTLSPQQLATGCLSEATQHR